VSDNPGEEAEVQMATGTLAPVKTRTVRIGRLRLRTFKLRGHRRRLDHYTAAEAARKNAIMTSALYRRWWQSGEIVLLPGRLVSWRLDPPKIEVPES
jgi:hypothetical protein